MLDFLLDQRGQLLRNKHLSIITYFYVIFLAGCEYWDCSYENDRYATLINTLSHEISVELRFTSYEENSRGEYKLLTHVLEPESSIEVYLETVEYSEVFTPIPTPCNDKKEKYSRVEFSSNTLTQFKVCINFSNHRGYEIKDLNAICETPNGSEIVEGF